MKIWHFVLIIFLAFFAFGYADIEVEYETSMTPELIHTEVLEGTEYFNVYELNKAFKASIKIDPMDQRLVINMYNRQLIILLESNYLQECTDIYSFVYPVILKQEKYMLPKLLLTETLPMIYPDHLTYKSGKFSASLPSDNSIRRIVIDPGHGGKDPGAVGYSKKHYEKDVTLLVGKKLKKKLEDNLDIEVILTRSSDEFVSLQQRTKKANEENADLFVSLHCNAHRSNSVKGIEVYYLSTAKTDEARAVEALENSVVYDYEGGEKAVKQYDDLAFILADMTQNEHLLESSELGFKLQKNTVASTKSKNRGVKQANFYVLRGAYMPAVLLELGFISNKEEEKLLIKPTYQDKLVDAIFKGIKDFKFKYDHLQ